MRLASRGKKLSRNSTTVGFCLGIGSQAIRQPLALMEWVSPLFFYCSR